MISSATSLSFSISLLNGGTLKISLSPSILDLICKLLRISRTSETLTQIPNIESILFLDTTISLFEISWFLTSIIPLAISPQFKIDIKLSALLIPNSWLDKSTPFSKRALESVLIPNCLEVFLTWERSKDADSKITVFVSSLIQEFVPPITPAITTGFLESAITKLFSESS